MTNPGGDRKRFFVHSAHATIGVSAGLAALQTCDLTGFAVAEPSQRRLHVGLVADCCDEACEMSLGRLQEYLAGEEDLICSRMFPEGRLEGLGFELDYADCLLVLARRPITDARLLRQVWCHDRRGGATVLLGAGSLLLRIGERTSGGLSQFSRSENGTVPFGIADDDPPTLITIAPSAADHPILAGVEPFLAHGASAIRPDPARGATVLLCARLGGQARPLAWTQIHHGARVFCTPLGQPADFRQPSFLRVLRNAVYWSCRQSG